MKPEVFVWECLVCGRLNRTPLPADGSEIALVCEHCGQKVEDQAAKSLFRAGSL